MLIFKFITVNLSLHGRHFQPSQSSVTLACCGCLKRCSQRSSYKCERQSNTI